MLLQFSMETNQQEMSFFSQYMHVSIYIIHLVPAFPYRQQMYQTKK
jgi:hypothetical protein